MASDSVKHIAVFVGTRPEAIKMAPVIAGLVYSSKLQPIVVSTGQHREMLHQVIHQFGLRIDHEFDVMVPGQTLAGLSSRLLPEIDNFLEKRKPDFSLAQGDTTTVLMTALGSFYRSIPFGHIEAGLRTDTIRSPFPEEANRRLVTPLASVHFAPTEHSRNNLLREGLSPETIHVTGNTIIDALQMELHQQQSEIGRSLDRDLQKLCGFDPTRQKFVLVTGHRRENFGDGFDQICAAVVQLAREFPQTVFLYPVHLNPNVQKPVRKTLGTLSNVRLTDPLSYRHFVRAMSLCHMVLTDSGGIQEEAPSLGKPVLVMRDRTERPEGVRAGAVKIIGTGRRSIVAAVSQLLCDESTYQNMATATNPYGDGHAARRIIRIIETYFENDTTDC